MRLSMVVAVAENDVIGRDNGLPWHLPNDLKFFKAITMGKPLVMGRKTYESIGRPLPGRPCIVISRNPHWQVAAEYRDKVAVVNSVSAAVAAAKNAAMQLGVDEVMIIGGAEIYRLLFEQADRLYLTRVHADVSGDATFPAVVAAHWREVGREAHAACTNNSYDYSFLTYDRVTKS